MGIKVGIDLGTTFCAVAMMDEKKGQPVIIPNSIGERITPSVIQFTEDGGVIVGAEAKDAFEAGETGCTSTFKRNMGREETYCSFYGREYTSVDLSAILLRYLKEETETVTGQQIDEAVVTVPAYFYSKERSATMRAAKMAGLHVRQIISEPTAAAMNYGVNHWRENAVIMVYDLGGGTFDVTLVQMGSGNRMTTLSTVGNHTLGGKDWDARICGILEQKIEEDTSVGIAEEPGLHAICMRTAETIKKQLTTRNAVTTSVQVPNYGRVSETITLEEFEQSTRDLLEKTGTLCDKVLSDLGITWKEVTDVLLVGGSTRMRQVSSYLERRSGHTPLSQVNPDEAVALGAAIQVHLPMPEYSVVSVSKGRPEAGGAGQEKEAGRGRGLFNFRKKEQGQPGARADADGAAHPAAGRFKVYGPVGKETSFDNALKMSHVDVVAHAMGVIAVNEEGTAYVNKTIIPANQSIPVKCAEAFRYYTSAGGENEVEIYVLQGTAAPLEAQTVGKYVVSGIEHNRNDNPTIIRIQYSYDLNGVVHVQARQGSASRDLPIREEPVPKDMSRFGRPIDPQEMAGTVAEPVSVVMAVDVSGSMEGSPMRDALAAMCGFVDQFEGYPGDAQIGAIAVSDRSQVVQELTADFDRCRSSIRQIKSCMTGICNAGQPFDDILSLLGKQKGKRVAIVLADGMWENTGLAISKARECHGKGIDVIGIGFGSADRKFMQAISHGDMDAMLVSQSELMHSFGKIAQVLGGSDQSGRKQGKDGSEIQAETWEAIGERL